MLTKEALMFELTPDQRAELSGPEPARAINPDTKAEYVLVRADLYERMKAVFEEDALDMCQVAKIVDQAMCEDDADDPSLESYQKYRTQS
jgi:hypothetical protein